jgi:hypothetical protein
MDRELARLVAIGCYQATAPLEMLLQILKDQLTEEEYAPYKQAIASVCGHVAIDIMHKALAAHPDVEKALEANIQKYGKAF